MARHAVEKSLRWRRIGIQEQEPVAPAEPAALVDGPGKATIFLPAPQRHVWLAPQALHERMLR